MRNVTKDEFFAALYADKRDIMPRIIGKWSDEWGFTQEWRAGGSYGQLFGITNGTEERNNKTYELVA